MGTGSIMGDMREYITTSPEETKELAARMLSTLQAEPGIRGTGTIVALQGDLGAGKTVFVKGVAEALGVQENVTSPTFVIEKIYPVPDPLPWKRLVHIDAYRLESEEELATIAWNDIVTDPGNLIMLEWPECVGMGVPERAYWLEFETIDENTRKISTEMELPDLR